MDALWAQVSAGGHHSAAVCTHDIEKEDAEERRRGGVKNRMWDWFAGAKLMIELPDGAAGSLPTPGPRSSRTTLEGGPPDCNAFAFSITLSGDIHGV
jgi:hypothetical protein